MTGYTISMGYWSHNYNGTTSAIIHESGSVDRVVHNASIDLNADGISKLTFTMPPDHPEVGNIEILKYGNTDKSISVYFDNTQLFHGYVVSKSEDINGEVTVTCEDDLGMLKHAMVTVRTLGDSVHMTPSNALQQILSAYNAVVDAQLYIGVGHAPDVGYTLNNVKGVDLQVSKPTNAWDLLKSIFVDKYGCTVHVNPRTSPINACTLQVYETEVSDSTQVVRFGENLVDYQSEVFDEGIYTAVVPVGANYNYLYWASHAEYELTEAAAAGAEDIYVSSYDPIWYKYVLYDEGNYLSEIDVSTYTSDDNVKKIHLKNALEMALPAGYKVEIWSASGLGKQVRPKMLDYTADASIVGRNLIRKSATLTEDDVALSHASVPEDGVIRLSPTSTSATSKLKIDYIPYSGMANKTVTFSCQLRVASQSTQYTNIQARHYIGVSGPNNLNGMWDSSKDRYMYSHEVTNLTTSWSRWHTTIKIPDDLTTGTTSALTSGASLTVGVYAAGATKPIEARRFKLEVGGVTPYTEAPEDGGADHGVEIEKKGVTLYDVRAVNRYGLRALKLDLPEIDHYDALLSSARAELAKHPTVPFTLEVSAIDMALYMDGYTHLLPRQGIRVVSEPHGIDTHMTVGNMKLNLDNPGNTKYTLGVRPDTVSGRIEQGRIGLALLDNDLSYRMQSM